MIWLLLALAQAGDLSHTRSNHLALWSPVEDGVGPSVVARELVLTPAQVDQLLLSSIDSRRFREGDEDMALALDEGTVLNVQDGKLSQAPDEGALRAAWTWEHWGVAVTQQRLHVVRETWWEGTWQRVSEVVDLTPFLDGDPDDWQVHAVMEKLPYDGNIEVPKVFLLPRLDGELDRERAGYVFGLALGLDEQEEPEVEARVARLLFRDQAVQGRRQSQYNLDAHEEAGIITQTPPLDLGVLTRNTREPRSVVFPMWADAGYLTDGFTGRAGVGFLTGGWGGRLEVSERLAFAALGIGRKPTFHDSWSLTSELQGGITVVDYRYVGVVGLARAELRVGVVGFSTEGLLALTSDVGLLRGEVCVHAWVWRGSGKAVTVDLRFRGQTDGVTLGFGGTLGARFLIGT